MTTDPEHSCPQGRTQLSAYPDFPVTAGSCVPNDVDPGSTAPDPTRKSANLRRTRLEADASVSKAARKYQPP